MDADRKKAPTAYVTPQQNIENFNMRREHHADKCVRSCQNYRGALVHTVL